MSEATGACRPVAADRHVATRAACFECAAEVQASVNVSTATG